jgi:hypothetical protein
VSAIAASREELLRAEVELLREQLTVVSALQMMDRFHGFDTIHDDRCPACGGAVVVEETARHVRLRSRA